jgi:hypothetical protein
VPLGFITCEVHSTISFQGIRDAKSMIYHQVYKTLIIVKLFCGNLGQFREVTQTLYAPLVDYTHTHTSCNQDRFNLGPIQKWFLIFNKGRTNYHLRCCHKQAEKGQKETKPAPYGA